MTARRLRVLLTLSPVALLLTPPWSGGPAVASCAAPPIAVAGQDVDRPVLARGSAITVTGERFVDGCDDTGGGGCEEDQAFPPYEDVVLRLTAGGRSQDLASASADADGDIAWEVVLPADLEPGTAVLETEVSDGLSVLIGPETS